ncbi:MAG: pyruvate:ferredoxin (flavodoxin) oxidoreductase [Candidatus Omnitrophica bacterium CG07_land_8_20_14_0_80_50_8]|nr:MAG: pyruvate:ferredoxin (flavodoxin) oxidoreductase [Candidatus Omnitrophica bacterium CG07_land_8_20_14_0_80_50_8]
MKRIYETLDANEAVAEIAYALNEVIAIYPITPASPMSEYADAWANEKRPNLWGTVPSVVEMQSEGGAAGVIHGALQTGALATTFTSSQGLLLMIPVMYKIAGELTPVVFHIAARSLATHALSIFGDQSDVMAARLTGFAFLSSNSVQEAQDFALIAHAATLKSRIPFVHFFDGFRTSHEISKIEVLTTEHLRAMIDEKLIKDHRDRALTPDRPVIRGTAQNPDVFFQSRETANLFYQRCPGIVEETMKQFAELTGRTYSLYEYHGALNAERVIVLMGSGCETAHETVDHLNKKNGKVGVLKVRLYRPLDCKRFVEALPASVRSIAVLDRTKEPGSGGEPLFLDCVSAIQEGLQNKWGTLKSSPRVIGGRYGLSSKEFTPAMVKGVFDNLALPDPKNHFTVGINDDVSHTSIPYDKAFRIAHAGCYQAIFFGLGSDGTVGANKNSIKIIGEHTDHFIQGYFVYDSKKAGAMTVSHLRFGPQPIRSAYLVDKANFVGCHQTTFLEQLDVLENIEPAGTFLLNTSHRPEEVWKSLPRNIQQHILKKKLKFFVIDGYRIAKECGLGAHINRVMQVCFFSISGILPREQAIERIKESIRLTYGKKGAEIAQINLNAVDRTLANVFQVKVPASSPEGHKLPPPVSAKAPEFVRNVIGAIIANRGNELPVSALPIDGTYPVGTTQWEKRNLAQEIPVWEPGLCIQCGKCAFVCPHGVIRVKAYGSENLKKAPSTFKSTEARNPSWAGQKYTIQVAPEDCTGCTICVEVCPAKSRTAEPIKAINMRPLPPIREPEKANWEFFLGLPETERRRMDLTKIREQQAQQPLFEFSGACAGCGETPYLKLLSQLFGDRSVVANATGCSSIYGGNLPTTPWTKNKQGRGPAWSNSLFEDNAEFGLGMRISIDKQRMFASELLVKLSSSVGQEFVQAILTAPQKDEADIYEQRLRVETLRTKLAAIQSMDARRLEALVDYFVKKDVWIVGGDGWAYDIGFGGLDHVIAGGANVNILVLDTEVYSNTGGQKSKSTPRGAVAKFASGGKDSAKKDLGLIAMSYGNVYVASVAMGAKDEHTLKAFLEAEAYEGPSLIIAYSHCIAHGIQMATALQNQKAAFDSGRWPLYRFNPDRILLGENPLQIETPSRPIPVEQYMMMENRFKMLMKARPNETAELIKKVQNDVETRQQFYKYLAQCAAKLEDIPSASVR